jgi:hypothetical protein
MTPGHQATVWINGASRPRESKGPPRHGSALGKVRQAVLQSAALNLPAGPRYGPTLAYV